jgi:hypothetical protein
MMNHHVTIISSTAPANPAAPATVSANSPPSNKTPDTTITRSERYISISNRETFPGIVITTT